MRVAVALTNLVLGTAYTSYGMMTAIEMKRGWRSYGFSHFGAAWIAMAFTCGPHHLAHGIHGFVSSRPGGGLDLFAVLVGLPVGIIWLLLRIEAFTGGRGDRFIPGTPPWLTLMPTAIGVYVTALAAGLFAALGGGYTFSAVIVPNMLLLFIYCTIGYFLLRTQLRNRAPLGGWSVSGLSLATIFPTCGLMHVVFASYVVTGRYASDVHGSYIDWLAVPAGLYFLWVVRGLYKQTLTDWNRSAGEPVVLAEAG